MKIKIEEKELFDVEVFSVNGVNVCDITVKVEKLSCRGEDGYSGPKLKGLSVDIFNRVDSENPFEIVSINLKSVRYVDSSGLSAILVLNRLHMYKNNKMIHMYGLRDSIMRLIQISQLDTVFNIYSNRDIFLESFSKKE